MTTFGQIIHIISVMVLLLALMMRAGGKLPTHLLLITGIATNLIGLAGSSIAGSGWDMGCHVVGGISFTIALYVHRYTARQGGGNP